MLSRIKEKIWLCALLVGLFGFISAVLLGVTDLFVFEWEELKEILSQNYRNFIIILGISGIFSFIFSFISYFCGRKVRLKINLEPKKLNKKDILILLSIGIIIPIILYLLDVTLYKSNIEGFLVVNFNPINLLSTLLYNGILEEIWFRYGLMSCLIYIFYKVFSNKKDVELTKKHIFLGMILAVLLVFTFQLNAIFTIYTFNALVFLRALILYAGMNFVYSYICLRYGVKYSILLHMLFVVLYAGILPFVGLLI